MPSDVLITPASSKVEFTDGSNATKTLRITGTSFSFDSDLGIGITSPTSKLNVLSTTSLSSVFKAEGVNGTLFEVTDDLSNSLMSVNTIGGLPVFEVFANNTIVAGQYNANDFVISGNKVGIGIATPTTKLEVVGAIRGGLFSAGTTNSGEAWFGRASDRALGSYTLQFGGASASGTFFELIDRAWSKVIFAVSGEAPTNTFKITSVGNLGIGDGSPNNKLHVAGSASIGSSYNTTGPTNGLIVQGNVGIGTTNPNAKFYVSAGTLAINQRAMFINADITTNTSVYTHTLNLIDSSADANTTSLALGTYSHVVFRNRAVTAGSAGGILDIYTRGVSTDPTVKMTITDVGNVGIGNTAPLNKLHVAGSASVGSSYNVAGPTNGLIVEGSVGIGTTNPATKLAIGANPTYAAGVTLIVGTPGNPSSSGTSQPYANLRLGTNTGNSQVLDFGIYDASPYGSWIQAAGGGNLAFPSPLVLNPTGGNIGIGVSNPTALLTIYNTAFDNNTDGFKFGYSSAYHHSFSASFNSSASLNNLGININNGFNTGRTRVLTLLGNGNIGIGITSPSAVLHVNSAVSGATLLRADGTNGTLFSVVDDLSDSLMSVNNSAGLPVLEVFADDRVVMGQYGQNDFVLVNNKLGLGTNNPAYKLDINGTLNVSGNTSLSTISITGTITSSATEAIRINNNNGFVSFYNTAGSSRTGYLQGNTGNSVLLASENNALLQFAVGGTVRATISTSGDVGIGTTAPTSQSNYRFLQVNGTNSAVIETMVGNTRIGGFDSDSSNLYVGTIGAFPIVFRTSVNEKWRITNAGVFQSNGAQTIQTSTGNLTLATAAGNGHIILSNHGTGNVGIGTVSPSSLLNVSGTGTLGSVFQEKITNGTTTLALGTNATAAEVQSQGSVPLYLNYGGNNVCIVPVGSGNVGIGTTTPNAPLVIHSNSTQLKLQTSSGPTAYFSTISSLYDSTHPFSIGVANNSASTTEYLGIYADGGGSNNRVSFPNGNVGIGNTSPAYKLDVSGTINTSNFMLVSYPYGNAFPLQLNASSFLKANDYYYGMTINSGDVNYISGKFLINGGTYKRVELYGYENGIGYIPTVIPGGNVGIGTTNPIAFLNVVGNGIHTILRNTSATSYTSLRLYNDQANIFRALEIDYSGSSYSGSLVTNGPTGESASIGTTGAYPLALTTNNTARLVISGGGNIGIGTTNPTAKLDTLGVRLGRDFSIANRATVRLDSNGTALPADILFGHTAAANETSWNGVYWSLSSRGSSDSNRFHFYRGSGNPTGASELIIMTLDPSMNVGIGTVAPLARLHLSNVTVNPLAAAISGESKLVISGVDGTMDLLSQDDNSTVSNVIGMGRYNATTGALIHKFGIVTWANTGSTGSNTGDRIGFHYGTNADSFNSTELLTIKANGNLGIGFTSPSNRLSVNGSASIGSNYNTAATTNGLIVEGNVGIGSSSPTQKLDVYSTNQDVARFYNNQTTFGLILGSISNSSFVNLLWQTSTGNAQFFKNRTSASWGGADSFNFYNSNGGFAFHPNGVANKVVISAGGDLTVNGSTSSNFIYPNGGVTGNDLYAQDIIVSAYHHGDSLRYDALQFNAPNTYETRATVGSSFVSTTVDTSIFKGDSFGGALLIPYGTYQVRWTWDNVGYRYFNLLYLGYSATGHSFTVLVEKSSDGVTWTQQYTSGSMGGWPSHGWYVAPWNNAGVTRLRITLTPTWDAGYSAYDINLYNMRYFCTYPLNGVNRLFDWDYSRNINFNGNIGIGVANPTAKLDVAGTNVNGYSLLLRSGDNYNQNDSVQIAFGFANQTNYRHSIRTRHNPAAPIGGVVGNNIDFYVWKRGTDAAADLGSQFVMTMQGDGAVGIGTTNPTNTLHIYSSANEPVLIQGTTAGTWLNFQSSTSNLMSIGADGTNGFAFYNRTSNSYLMMIRNNGNIGIGNITTSNNKLHVDGSMSVGSGYNTAGPTNGLIVQGSVGIGVTNPNTALQVVGTGIGTIGTINIKGSQAHLGLTTSGGVFKGWYGYFNNSANGSDLDLNIKTGYEGASNIRIGANGDVTQVFISGSGNVGVGTLTPTSKLNILSSTSLSSVFKAEGINGTLFEVTDDLSNSLMSVNTIGGLPVFEVFANNTIIAGQYGANDFVINGNKIGVGTANPSFKLDVNGTLGVNAGTSDGNWPFIVVDTNTAGGTNRYALNKIGAMGFNYPDSYAQLQLVGANGAYIDFNNAAADDFDARIIYYSNSRFDIQYGTVMTINSTGVGIATTTPYTRAHVYGTLTVDAAGAAVNSFTEGIRLGAATNGYSIVTFGANAAASSGQITNQWWIGKHGSDNSFNFNSQGGGDVFRILQNGNVGIGNTNPGYKLYVNGTSYFNGALQVNSNITLSGGGDVIINDSDGTGFFASYMDAGVAYMRVDDGGTANGSLYINSKFFVGPSTGNVGVGTVTPASLFHVSKAGNSAGGTILMGVANDNTTKWSYLVSTQYNSSTYPQGFSVIGGLTDSTSNKVVIGGSIYEANPATEIQFYTHTAVSHNTGGSLRMVINTNGNVGIGAASPADKLDVNGNLYFSKASDPLIYAGSGIGLNIDGQALYLNRYTNANIAMVIGGGNVGVGTTNPLNKLHIVQSIPTGAIAAPTNTTLRLDSSSNNYLSFVNTSDNSTYAGLTFTDNNVGGYIVFRNYTGDVLNGSDSLIYGTYQDHIFQTGTTSGINSRNEVMRIKNGGNVGIGSNSPNNKLHVNGSTSIGSGYNTAGPTNGLIVEGSVGIGVTSPSSKLHVWNGTVQVSGFQSIAAGPLTFLRSDYNGSAAVQINFLNINPSNGYDSDLGIQLMNVGGSMVDVMRIKGSTGNVGIGTITPSARLHINSTTSGATLLRADGTNGTLFSVVDDLSDSLMSVNNSAGLPVLEVFADDRIVAGQYGANDFVLVNNKLGLGTNSPNKQLTFAQVDDDAIQIRRRTIGQGGPAAGTGISWTWTSSTTDNETWAAIRAIFPGNGDTHLTFSNRPPSGATTERMRIQNNGNVGIGVTTPRQILHVNGSILLDGVDNGYTQGATRAIGYGSNSGAINTDGFSGMDIQSVNAPAPNAGNYSQNLRFWTHHYGTGTGGTPRMIIQYNGNVGIGTTAPAALLQVGTGSPTASTSGIQFGDDTSARIYRDSSTVIKVSGGFQSSTYIYATNYLQTGGNLIYPSSQSATQRLEVGNAANNAWIDGLTIAPGGNVVIAGYLNAGGQTLNGQSFYQWEGATYRNPADHTPQFLLREDNSSTGINGFAPALALYNNNGGNQTTVGMVFVSAEAVSPTQGNAVNLAGIIAKKESAGTAGGWSRGSLNFFVKDFGTKVDALTIQYTGSVGIGTSNPATLLQINTGTPIAATGGIQFGDDTGTRLYRSGAATITCSGTIAGTFSGTATNATQLGGVAASSYVRNDVDGTDSTALFRLKTITKSLTVTTSWIDTGIVGADLPDSGAYILTLNVDNYAVGGGHYNETYTGIMYWYAGGTNDLGADEIPLHKSGHAPNGRYINLRTVRQSSGGTNLKLQIISSVTTTGASNYIFKFRRMI